jgi:hypothetical protein
MLVRSSDLEAARCAAFALKPNGGLILTPDPAAIAHRELLINLASRHRLPAVCRCPIMIFSPAYRSD